MASAENETQEPKKLYEQPVLTTYGDVYALTNAVGPRGHSDKGRTPPRLGTSLH